jgi:hypothetical protein
MRPVSLLEELDGCLREFIRLLRVECCPTRPISGGARRQFKVIETKQSNLKGIAMMSNSKSSPVLQAATIGNLLLKNRVVMAPMTRSRSDDAGVPPGYAADYYAQRADAGLIIRGD